MKFNITVFLTITTGKRFCNFDDLERLCSHLKINIYNDYSYNKGVEYILQKHPHLKEIEINKDNYQEIAKLGDLEI